MKTLLLALLSTILFATAPRAQAGGTRPAPGAQPMVVLLRHSVWFSAIDWPLFILYDDGTAVFPRTATHGLPITYQAVHVDVHDREAALARLGLTRSLSALSPTYDFMPNMTDMETVYLMVWRGDTLSRVAVRAGVRDNGFAPGVPEPFRVAWQRLTRFGAAGAQPWSPPELQVYAWPYEYTPSDPPLPWPAGWPDLRSPGSSCRQDPVVKEMCTLRLPAARVNELNRFLGRRRERQAIGINGRKMTVRGRLIFPGEQRWTSLLQHLEN